METAKIGEFKFKESHQKFWRMKIEKMFGKRESWEYFSEIGESETGGNASLPQRDGRACQ